MDRERVKRSIINAAGYLFSNRRDDGGVDYVGDNGGRSGIWVTAETLEALLLSSAALSFPAYGKIEPMISFLVQTQNVDGSWAILAGDNEPSVLSTGHCTYALKLAMVGDYLERQEDLAANGLDTNIVSKESVRAAIDKGEKWLRQHRMRSQTPDGWRSYWRTQPSQGNEPIDPNVDLERRMDIIISSFYAMMGFVNPRGYRVTRDEDDNLLREVKNYFREQIDFFADRYCREQVEERLYPQVASTICRLTIAKELLEIKISSETSNRFCVALEHCVLDPFTVTPVVVNTDRQNEATQTYNNNTPFDVAIALMSIGFKSDKIDEIVNKYIAEQTPSGFWSLNFDTARRPRTWPTSEAIIVLNKALEIYMDIKISEDSERCKSKIAEFEEKCKRVERNYKIFNVVTIIALVLFNLVVIALSVWCARKGYWGNVLATIMSVAVSVGGISSITWACREWWSKVQKQ